MLEIMLFEIYLIFEVEFNSEKLSLWTLPDGRIFNFVSQDHENFNNFLEITQIDGPCSRLVRAYFLL